MTPRGRRLLWTTLGAGLIVRTILAFATVGQEFDIGNLQLVAMALDHPLHLYSTVNGDFTLGEFEVGRWPYPSGIFPWLGVSRLVQTTTGLPFHGIVQLAPIAADAGIAWLVQGFLGRRGASERTRLAATVIVMAGPAFWVISGYHGQIDSVAFLPAVAALVLWVDGPIGRRALYAGLLIGLGGSVKTAPLFMVFALLPTVRSAREAVTLLAAAGAVMVAAMAPFLIADFAAVRKALGYSGAPGLGGITLIAQPELSTANLTQRFAGVEVGAFGRALYDHAQVVVLVAFAVVAAYAARLRAPGVQSAVLVWLAFYTVSPAFFFQYLVWGLPFCLMAGHLRAVVAVQLLIVPPLLAYYFLPWSSDRIALAYVPAMAALWLAGLVAGILQARQIARGRPVGADATV